MKTGRNLETHRQKRELKEVRRKVIVKKVLATRGGGGGEINEKS